MVDPNFSRNPDSYNDYNQSPIEYIDAPHSRQQLQQEYPIPAYPRNSVASNAQGEKLKVQRRSKAESLALVSTFKKWLIAASLVGFGVFSALVAGNAVGASAQTTTFQPTNNNPQVTSPSQNDNGGGFFQQQQPDQGGYNFGANNAGSQGPVSGSHTS